MKMQLFRKALAIIAVAGFATIPMIAAGMDCSMEPTVQSLEDCVQHAAEMGHIDNVGVAKSLLSKLHSAEVVRAHDGPAYWTTINILRAFIGEVQAQSGKHIDAEHAHHMELHAQMIIDALQGSG